jgi:hypothetical protein
MYFFSRFSKINAGSKNFKSFYPHLKGRLIEAQYTQSPLTHGTVAVPIVVSTGGRDNFF